MDVCCSDPLCGFTIINAARCLLSRFLSFCKRSYRGVHKNSLFRAGSEVGLLTAHNWGTVSHARWPLSGLTGLCHGIHRAPVCDCPVLPCPSFPGVFPGQPSRAHTSTFPPQTPTKQTVCIVIWSLDVALETPLRSTGRILPSGPLLVPGTSMSSIIWMLAPQVCSVGPKP